MAPKGGGIAPSALDAFRAARGAPEDGDGDRPATPLAVSRPRPWHAGPGDRPAQPRRLDLLRLRRRRPRLLPGLAARVHPQPSRQRPDAVRSVPAEDRCGRPRLRPAGRRHRLRRRPRRRCPGELDHGLRRQRPDAPPGPADIARSMAGADQRPGTQPDRSRRPGHELPRQSRQLRRCACGAGPAAGSGQPRRDGQPSHRAHPVALHGRRP